MIIAFPVVSVVLTLVVLASGATKVRRAPTVVANLTSVRVPGRVIPGLGALETTATLGLLAGLFWWPLGLAAAIGLIGLKNCASSSRRLASPVPSSLTLIVIG